MNFDVTRLPIILSNRGNFSLSEFVAELSRLQFFYILPWQYRSQDEIETVENELRIVRDQEQLFCIMSDFWWDMIQAVKAAHPGQKITRGKYREDLINATFSLDGIVEWIGAHSLLAKLLREIELIFSSPLALMEGYYHAQTKKFSFSEYENEKEMQRLLKQIEKQIKSKVLPHRDPLFREFNDRHRRGQSVYRIERRAEVQSTESKAPNSAVPSA
jgi:hypothetical protein